METHYSISKSLNQPYYHQPERTILLYKINKVNSDPGGGEVACSHPHSCVDLYTDLYSKYIQIYMFVCLYRFL